VFRRLRILLIQRQSGFWAGVLRRFPETYRAEILILSYRSCKGGQQKIEACESEEEGTLVQLKP
jgi:hypothetical protein